MKNILLQLVPEVVRCLEVVIGAIKVVLQVLQDMMDMLGRLLVVEEVVVIMVPTKLEVQVVQVEVEVILILLVDQQPLVKVIMEDLL
jgi:hypothetical protein